MLIDTNALSAWADGKDSLHAHLSSAQTLLIPSIVLGEFYFGIQRSRYQQEYRAWLRKVIPQVRIANISHNTAQNYSEVRNHLKEKRTPIPANDTWIAALSLQLDLPLLSNDQHFDLVPHLTRLSF